MTVVLVRLHGETSSNCSSFGYTLKKIILVLSISVYFWMTASESLRSAMISSSESLGASNLGIMPWTITLSRASFFLMSNRYLQ